MEAPGILNLIGGIITLLVGVFVAVAGAAAPLGAIFGALVGAVGIWGVIVGLLLIVSAVKYEKSHGWAIIGLVFAILGLVTLQGLIIGPLLGIIGSALAMGKKSAAPAKK